MDLETYKTTFSDDDMPGWAAIDQRLAEAYSGREADFHFGTIIGFRIGGRDPIDHIRIYKRTEPAPHLRYIGYGMSELYYNEDAAGGEFSKWGFEFTFRLAMTADEFPSADDEVPVWPINLMQNMARYVFETGKWFGRGHFIPTNGPIKIGSDTKMAALLFCLDPELGSIDTPHGEVDFLQIVGLTENEEEGLFAKKHRAADLIDVLSRDNPLLITDLARSEDVI